jgi:hypothetical protein
MATLTQTVTKIVGYEVTPTQAKNYALNNYGILATHIRNEFLDSVNLRKKTKKKPLKDIKVIGSTSKKYKQ